MQRKEALTENEVDRTLGHMLDNPKMKDRVTSLAPYIAEIQRRKKLRGLAKQSKKNLNQSSSRSFRIKQQSLSSLHKETFLKTRQTTVNTIVSRLNEYKPHRGHRGQSLQRHRELQSSKTIDSRPKHAPSAEASTFFNQLYVRVKSKVEKERPMRKKQYQTIQVNRTRSQHQADLSIAKIGHTNPGHVLICNEQDRKKHQKVKKNNFRRNKFEADIPPPLKIERVEAYSEGRSQLGKKESNVSLNRQMDRLAEKQMDYFYKQIRNKQIHRSVEHYTEQYFKNQSYRPIKSKNEIEVFVSIAKNPLIQKEPQMIPNQTFFRQESSSALLYDFDFPEEEVKWKKIIIQKPSQSLRE